VKKPTVAAVFITHQHSTLMHSAIPI